MTCWFPSAVAIEPPATDDLTKAVAAMRRINPTSLSDEQKQAKSQELAKAWKTLVDAGTKCVDALKEEIRKINASEEKDDFFMLSAAAVLWQISKVGEAKTIAALWSGDVSLSTNYNYVFFTAFEAARTQDPRVLPMLIAILRSSNLGSGSSNLGLGINN
jgi:hypothetical protein